MTYEPSSFDLAAAVLRRSGNWQELLGYLCTKLQAALPNQTRIERGGMFGRGPVRKITIDIGDYTYTIEERRNTLVGQRAKAVRGVVLSHEELALDYWVRALTAELQQLAQQSELYSEAIRRLSLE